MKIELFFRRVQVLRGAPRGTQGGCSTGSRQVEWRDVDVLDELDYAVELGVLTLPAIAIDGELAFASLPSPADLCSAIAQRLASGG